MGIVKSRSEVKDVQLYFCRFSRNWYEGVVTNCEKMKNSIIGVVFVLLLIYNANGGFFDSVKKAVKKTVDKAVEKVEDTVDKAKETVKDTVDSGKKKLEDTVDKANEMVKDTVDSGKKKLEDTV